MRWIVGVLLLIHGFVHLSGFVVPWKLTKSLDTPYKTTLFYGQIEVGDRGIRLVGILWLILSISFLVAGAGVFGQYPFWKPVTLTVSNISLLLCLFGLPESRIGVFVNIAILAYVVTGGLVT